MDVEYEVCVLSPELCAELCERYRDRGRIISDRLDPGSKGEGAQFES